MPSCFKSLLSKNEVRGPLGTIGKVVHTFFLHFGHILVICHEKFDRISWIFEDFSIFFQLWTARSPWLLDRFQKVWAFLISALGELSIALRFVVERENPSSHFPCWKNGNSTFWNLEILQTKTVQNRWWFCLVLEISMTKSRNWPRFSFGNQFRC